MKRASVGLFALLLPVLLSHAAFAQRPSPAPSSSGEPVQISASTHRVPPEVLSRVETALYGPDRRGKDGPLSPIGRELAMLYYQHEAQGPSGVRRLSGVEAQVRTTSRAAYHSPVSPDGRSVAVTAIASTTPEALLSDLRGLGLEAGATAGNVVSGRLPISALKAAARLSSLRGALPAYARTHVVAAGADSVQSEADTAHAAPQGRADLGVDGSGQKVCALSDSYDQDGSAATSASDDVSTGDLPGPGSPDGNTTPVEVLDDSEPGSDEGRAMLQLIHDIAPGAKLGFHTAVGGVAVFAQGVRDLAGNGCTVIVDDISYNVEPFYQDGPVSNAVDDVVQNDGVAYFSSAGNDGRNSYEAPFRDSGNPGVLSDTSVAHDFAPGAAVDTLQEVTIQEGGDFGFFTFQWTDPSAIVAGSKGADTDLDVALVDDTLGVVAQSARDSDASGSGLPFESLRFTNAGADTVDTDGNGVPDTTFHLVIEKATGPDPDEVKYIYSGSSFSIEEHDTLGPTIYGHQMAEGATAVAAAAFYNTTAYNPNVDPAVLEPFSSKGGIPILFDQNGTRLGTPDQRQKPEVTGTDGIDNTFFGGDLSDSFFGGVDADPYPNFFGTSAAAPNVAAIAALIREANPGFTPSDVYAQLETNAEDVTRRQDRDGGQPVSIGGGVDPWSGHGFVQAVGSALPVELARFDATADGNEAVLTWKTTSETNSAGFAVEHRRGDEGPWTELAYKEGAGTTTDPQRYRYRTAALEPGTHTFRLKQVDLDGSSTYSEKVTVTVALSGTHSVSAVTPNPVRTRGTVSITVREKQTVRAALYNTLGQQVAFLHDGPLPAQDPRTFTVGDALPSGVYFLRVEGESFTTTKKFVCIQ
ncbi:MAG: S8 family serine peptidase [Salinibacter sp.]